MTIGRAAILTKPHNGRLAVSLLRSVRARLRHALVLQQPRLDAARGARRRASSRCARTASSPRCSTIAKRSRARGVRVIDAQTMQDARVHGAHRVSLRVDDRVGASAAQLEEHALPRRSRQLERNARPLRDGSSLWLGRVGYGAGVHRQAHDRPPAERHLHRALPKRERRSIPTSCAATACRAVRDASGWGRGSSMPGYGAAFKQSLIDDLGPWTLSASGWGETLPHEDNRVTLDPDVKDKWGIPGRAHRRALARQRARDGQGHDDGDGRDARRGGLHGHSAARLEQSARPLHSRDGRRAHESTRRATAS